MLVGVIDVPVLVVLGALSALLYRETLRSRWASWYAILTGLSVVIVWLNVALGNLWPTGLWPIETAVVSLPSIVGVPHVLSYPLWFRAAGESTFVLFGRRPDQGGLLWVFRLEDRTDVIRTPWDRTDTARREN